MKLKLLDVRDEPAACGREKIGIFHLQDPATGASYTATVNGAIHDYQTIRRWYFLAYAMLAADQNNEDLFIEIDTEPTPFSNLINPDTLFRMETEKRPHQFVPKPYKAKPERERKDLA